MHAKDRVSLGRHSTGHVSGGDSVERGELCTLRLREPDSPGELLFVSCQLRATRSVYTSCMTTRTGGDQEYQSWISKRMGLPLVRVSQVMLVVKSPPANAGDAGSILGSGKIPWRRKWQPTQYYCLENPMDRGAWWGTVHGATQSQTQLNN